MKLEAFRFRHLGPFGADGVSVDGLGGGLNVIAEPNERGKSSLLKGLELILFRPHTSWDRHARALEREDGTPVGEVDFTQGGRAWRLRKQFVRGRDAQLIDRRTGAVVARKGEAEERLSELLGAAQTSRGPSGLLWVRQGTSMDGVRDDGQVASKLETELSTLVGGERARDYLAKTEERLGELLTATGRPKKGGPLQTALDALADAEAEHAAAVAARDALAQSGRELVRTREQLRRLETDDTEDTDAEIEQAREALSRARAAQSTLDASDATARRLTLEAEQADEALEAFLARCAEADVLERQLEKLGTSFGALESDRAEAHTALAQATERMDLLQARQGAVARHAEYKALQVRLTDRNAALQSVLANLDALDAVERERAEAIAERDARPAIAKGDLDELVNLERDRDGASDRLSRIEVTLHLDLDAGATARLDGAEVKAGPVTLRADSVLDLPGGSVRLDHPDVQALRDAHALATDAFEGALARLGVGSLEAAAEALRLRQDRDADIRAIDKQRAVIAPDGRDALVDARTRLEDDMARLSERLEDMGDAGDDAPEDVTRALAEATGERNAAQKRLSTLDTEHATVSERLHAARRQRAAYPSEVSAGARDAHTAKLSAAAASARSRADAARSELETLRARIPSDPAMIEARIERLSAFARNRSEELSRLRMREAELAATRREAFERRDPESEATRLEAVVARLSADLARHRRRADALTLLRDTLRDSQSALQAAYTAPVRRELLPLLGQVIDGADVALDSELGATSLVRGGQDDALERLSGGTQEQVAILTRLAFARLLARGGQPCPVILDDALVYADDARRARMFDVLNHVSRGDNALQLLYLSCHAANTAALGGNRLTLGSWKAED